MGWQNFREDRESPVGIVLKIFMKILYIHQYFKTPEEPGGTRSYWLARELIENGHEVTMLTTSTSTDSRVVKRIDGIEVIYLRVDYDQKMSIVKRFKSFVSFMLKATLVSLKLKRIDFVIATSTPLTVGIPALVLKKIRRIPFLFEVRDLWPEVPIQMGALNNQVLRRLAKILEKFLYLNAKHIVALSPGMKDGVVRCGIAPDKVSMIPNMAKVDEFYPREKNYDLLESFKLKRNSFKVVHFGSLGIANGANSIIQSAILLKDCPDIEFIFIGGGSTESDLRTLCESSKLSNVHFLGKFGMETTSEIVNFCDVSLVSFMDIPILYTNSPNKLFDSLSAGKPIIVNSAGWTKDLVEKSGCGYYVDPNEPHELAEKLMFLSRRPNIVRQMGEISRKLAIEKYDKSILTKEFVSIINRLSEDNG